MAWQVASEDLKFRAWDDQTVVYDARSGDTHCMDRIASSILTHLLRHDSSSLHELSGLFGVGTEQRMTEDGEATLLAALGELERLRIIRQVAE
jgi:PqqD family protein of HPr-rel-A system